MIYANRRSSSLIDYRIYRTLFGFLSAPLLLLVSAGLVVAV